MLLLCQSLCCPLLVSYSFGAFISNLLFARASRVFTSDSDAEFIIYLSVAPCSVLLKSGHEHVS